MKTKRKIYNDIYNFVSKLYKKYKDPLSIKFFNQLDIYETNDLYNISPNIINDILNFNNGIDLEINDVNDELIEEDINYIENGNKMKDNKNENNIIIIYLEIMIFII